MLIKTNIEFDLVTDPELLTMMEKSKRGGLTFIGSERYAKANNKHTGVSYDKTKESSCAFYGDALNLYCLNRYRRKT